MHPQVHALQNVPAAVVDDAADLGGVEGAGEVGVHVVVVVQTAAAMQWTKRGVVACFPRVNTSTPHTSDCSGKRDRWVAPQENSG